MSVAPWWTEEFVEKEHPNETIDFVGEPVFEPTENIKDIKWLNWINEGHLNQAGEQRVLKRCADSDIKYEKIGENFYFEMGRSWEEILPQDLTSFRELFEDVMVGNER